MYRTLPVSKGLWASARSYFRLLRWLAPWSKNAGAPKNIAFEEVQIDSSTGRQVKTWIYWPKHKVSGVYLVTQGLHYAGPADARLDRFCRVLADAGNVVVAPFLPDFIDLVVTPRVAEDLDVVFRAVFDLVPQTQHFKPGIFSVSFGSFPTLVVAAKHSEKIGKVLLFGGYCDFIAALRFCMTGQVASGRTTLRDPLNQPVLFMNFLPFMPEAPSNIEPIVAAWNIYVARTWGRGEYKNENRFHEIAKEVGSSLPAELQEFFFIGCGVTAGGNEIFENALQRASDKTKTMDPSPYLSQVTCPVHVVHGVEDDVIPAEQAALLYQKLSPLAQGGLHVTGIISHSGQNPSKLRGLFADLRALWGILRALSRGGRMAPRMN